MKEVTLANFRCFRHRQTAQLAPLTILVGENSTGKTSFLALTRVLWDIAFQERFPDFKEPPYDLGSFDEIAHFRGGRGGRATEFEAGFSIANPGKPGRRRARCASGELRFHVTFRRDGSTPLPSVRRIESGKVWSETQISSDGTVSLTVGTSRGRWEIDTKIFGFRRWGAGASSWDGIQRGLPPFGYQVSALGHPANLEHLLIEHEGTTPPSTEDLEELGSLAMFAPWDSPRPFPNAPVRSRPHRTYDPAHAIPDPEGEYIPMFLASVARSNQKAWKSLKSSLERFGQEAGLFDEIAIKALGGKAGGPFQVEIRKFGKRAKGPRRNMIDVGYGVSQTLPIITELLRPDAARMFLLQQPEVHLHPSAQAALGSLFCNVAANRRQLLVETHSDHLIDRIRMDVRDEKSKLRAEDVSILYFERRNLSVTIHSLGWDANGNLEAKGSRIPKGYRQFFKTETRRSLGI